MHFIGAFPIKYEKEFHGKVFKDNEIAFVYTYEEPVDIDKLLTVLSSIRNHSDVELLNRYFNASEEEKDYSVIGTFAPADATGKCVYCNHCQPCPAGIDIAMVNKYYDLALVGDEMAKELYKNLSKHADDCIQCGHCNSRCPFSTNQIGIMAEIVAYGW